MSEDCNLLLEYLLKTSGHHGLATIYYTAERNGIHIENLTGGIAELKRLNILDIKYGLGGKEYRLRQSARKILDELPQEYQKKPYSYLLLLLKQDRPKPAAPADKKWKKRNLQRLMSVFTNSL